MGEWTRRQFLARAGALAVLSQVPALLRAEGLLDVAQAADTDLTHDTLNGLVAFILPGNDPYSVAQGEQASGPGGVAAEGARVLAENLDRFLPEPDQPVPNDDTVPLSGSIANLLNTVALSVNPAAANGPFLSPFARLSLADKAKVFQMLEAQSGVPDNQLPQPFTQASGNFAFVAGILPGFTAFVVGSEAAVFDPATKTLKGRPVSWQVSGYSPNGPVQGWDELKGYFQGRRQVSPR